MDFNLGEYVENVIIKQGRTRTWVASQSDIKYKTFVDKITSDRLSGKELLRVAKVLNINLEELKGEI